MTAAGGQYGLARRILWPSQGLSIIQSTVFYLQTDNPIKKSTLRVLFFIDGMRGMAEGSN